MHWVTGVRDYIHVVDLALGHVAALKHIDGAGCKEINLGSGKVSHALQVEDCEVLRFLPSTAGACKYLLSAAECPCYILSRS